MKIWDKNTATSRAPLRRVRDRDISPAEEEEKLFSFNSKQRGYISLAMHIARSRVQYPREQRAQNINEFVDQKKEMFLAELAFNTVEEEIKDLELKQNRRDESLLMSQEELERDNIDLIQFIHHDNSLKVEKEQKERREQQKKQEREE